MAGGWRRVRGVTAWERAGEPLRSLALQVMEDALLSLSRGPLIPFAVVETAERATLQQLDHDLIACREWLADLPAGVERAVFARLGDITVHDERFHAVYVEAHERGMPAGARLGQRYQLLAGNEPELIGTAFDAGDGPALLA